MRASKHIKMKRMWQKDEFKQNINVLSPFVIKKKQHTLWGFPVEIFQAFKGQRSPMRGRVRGEGRLPNYFILAP